VIVVSAGVALLLRVVAAGVAPQGLAPEQASPILVVWAHDRPDSARAAITRLVARSMAPQSDGVAAGHLAEAAAIARAYAAAWTDSFFVRQVAVFERWSTDQRTAKVLVDSLRRAGNDALGRAGARSALRLWRASLRVALSLGDSAGQAAALGNIGVGFYRAGTLDSAAEFLARSRDLAIGIGDHRTAGNAVGLLASVAKDRGDLARARALYTRAGAIRARSGDTRGQAADQNNLGLIALTLGDLDGARDAFEAALAINRRENRATAAAVNLTNLANVASLTSDFPRASALYRDALATYETGGFIADAASVLHEIGKLAMRRGDYGQAQTTLRKALSLADSTGAVGDAVAIRVDLAAAYGAMGKLQGALTLLRHTERIARTSRAGPRSLATIALARADLAFQLNDLDEAEGQYIRAAALFRDARDVAGQSAARQGQGLLLLLREDYAGAARVFARASHADAAAGDARSAALTRLLFGYALAEQGDTAVARDALTAVAHELGVLGDAVGEATALNALGNLALRGGAAFGAESLYHRGLDRLGRRSAPDVTWQLHAGLGDALRSRGALADAAREMRSAVSEIERMSGSLRVDDRRAAFLADKWDVFARLALTERARGRDGDAFAASERLRARQMLDLVVRGHMASPGGPPDTVRAREQSLRRQISDLTRGLEGRSNGDETLREPALNARTADQAREALAAAQRSYANLLIEMRETDPTYARLVSGETASWRDVASRLAADEALLEYLVTDSTALVFVVTRDTVEAIELDVSRRALTDLIGFARGTLSRPVSALPGAMWRSPLRRLGRLLIAPVMASGLLDGKRTLVIVPHGELHFLPFQALLIGASPERFLVERFIVTYAPSASLWLRLGERRTSTVAGGVLAFAPRTDALPATRGEVDTIAAVYGDRVMVLTSGGASEHAFRALAPTKSIVHIAAYGVLNKQNPLFSFVELAPDETQDGRLEVHEVLALTLSARLIVLSACQTALGSGAIADVPPGDDWVGLVESFLYAGAANVVATLWSVEDRATARLMSSFYRELTAGQSEGAALAAAQRIALKDPRTADPFYWAGFSLSGGGQTRR
jgi:CHAT domain-containing protein/Tfp pilus assembly protein PilF